MTPEQMKELAENVYPDSRYEQEMVETIRYAFLHGLQTGLSHDRWIPCTERLPTKDDADKYNRVVWHYADKYSDVDDWNDIKTIEIATHWQPLPVKPTK